MADEPKGFWAMRRAAAKAAKELERPKIREEKRKYRLQRKLAKKGYVSDEKLAKLEAKERARREREERKKYERGWALSPGAKKTIKIFLIFFILVIVIGWFLLYGGYRAYASGVMQSWFTRGKVVVAEAEPIQTFYGQIKYFLKDPWNALDRYFNPMRTAKVEDKKEEKGIKITKFYSRSDVSENEPLVAIAEVKVFSLEDQDTNVGFLCLGKDDKKGKVSISGREGNVITIYEDTGEQFFEVTCEMPGIKIGEVDKSLEEVSLVAEYSTFPTRGSLDACILSKERLDELTGKNPFEEEWGTGYKSQVPNLQSNMRMRSLSTSGPIIVTLGTAPQPLSEVGDYLSRLTLDKSLGYTGKLKEIKSVKLFFPENLEFIPEKSDFGSNFKLKEEVLKAVNEKLSELEEADVLELKPFYFYFRVKPGFVSDNIGCSVITATVVYDYSVDQKTTVEVVKRSYS